MIKPDFNNSILNISATLADYLGNKNDIPKLPILQNELKKDYKNIVFMVFDGLGVYDINELTNKDNFLQSSIKQVLSSTMPATTVNATTTMISAMYPDEHLWIAWSMYFKDQKRVIDVYLDQDSYTKEKVDCVYEKHPFTQYYKKVNTDRNIYTILPCYSKQGAKNNIVANNIKEGIDSLKNLLKEKDKKFIYYYCDKPDSSMHQNGVHSDEVRNDFNEIQKGVQELSKEKDTLIIITADHGHIDVNGYIEIYKDKEITDMLTRPFSLEPRNASFKIKFGKKKKFVKVFNEKYGKDFQLYQSKELITEGFYGLGKNTKKLKQFLGDYISIGNENNKILIFSKDSNYFKGHHAGGTKEEMEVPLIIIGDK